MITLKNLNIGELDDANFLLMDIQILVTSQIGDFKELEKWE